MFGWSARRPVPVALFAGRHGGRCRSRPSRYSLVGTAAGSDRAGRVTRLARLTGDNRAGRTNRLVSLPGTGHDGRATTAKRAQTCSRNAATSLGYRSLTIRWTPLTIRYGHLPFVRPQSTGAIQTKLQRNRGEVVATNGKWRPTNGKWPLKESRASCRELPGPADAKAARDCAIAHQIDRKRQPSQTHLRRPTREAGSPQPCARQRPKEASADLHKPLVGRHPSSKKADSRARARASTPEMREAPTRALRSVGASRPLAYFQASLRLSRTAATATTAVRYPANTASPVQGAAAARPALNMATH
jgi:hypothetical protein